MNSELVTIAHEFSPLKANLMRTRLEADGIECFLHGETLSSVVGPLSEVSASWSHPEGNIALQVPAFDADRARDILREIESAPRDKEDEDAKITSTNHLTDLSFRLLVSVFLSLIAFALAGGLAGDWWSGSFNWLVSSVVGIGIFIMLSIVSFKKSFKQKR